jgi:DNA replication protein DnaC
MNCERCGQEQRKERVECLGTVRTFAICGCGTEYPSEEEQRKKAYWNDCKVPEETRGWIAKGIPEDDENREALAVARDYCKHLDENIAAGRGLVFLGTTGTMKTVILSTVLKYACDHYKSCRWIGYRKIVKIITDESYREDMAEELDRIARYPLILIDDIGCEPVAPWQKVHVSYLIDQRFEKKMPTLYTANCNLAELTEKLGADIVSRITGTCKVAIMVGRDRRQS